MLVFGSNLDALRRRGVGVVQIVGVVRVVVAFLCAVAVIESASGDDADLAAADVGLPVGFQSFAATARSLDIDFAAFDGHDGITLDAGGRLGLQILGVPLTVTRADDGGTPAVDDDVLLAVDALSTLAAGLNVDDAAIDDDGVRGLDAVIDGGVDVEVDTLVDDHIALRVDAVVVCAIDVERPRAAEE